MDLVVRQVEVGELLARTPANASSGVRLDTVMRAMPRPCAARVRGVGCRVGCTADAGNPAPTAWVRCPSPPHMAWMAFLPQSLAG